MAPEEGRVLHERWEPTLVGIDDLACGTDPRVGESFRRHAADTYLEYVVELDRALVEPSRGWAVRGLNRLVPRSLPYGKREHAPAAARYLVKRLGYGTRPLRLETLVSLRDKYETGYWHVFDDVLPRLFVLRSVGVGDDVPIVVSQALHDAPYFRAILARTGLDRRNWVVQNGRVHVRGERAYFCRPLRYHRPYFDRLLRLVSPEPAGDRRLFVTRRGRYRTLSNLAEIEGVADAAGLEVVDPGELSFDEQVALFASARKVAGVHGAGLANLLFRAGAPLDLLELFPSSWIEPPYRWVCRAYGYGYRAMVGELTGEYDFTIDPRAFERELEALVAT
jgi:hypothetical protein